MSMRRAFRILVWSAVCLLLGLLALAGAFWWWAHPRVQRTVGIVYGRRHGQPLTFNMLRPTRPNGLGVLVMVSGSWKSSTNPVPLVMLAPLLRHGYTLFTVRHQSQPQSTVMEIVADVQRAVRFIRHHAREYGVDRDRLGVTGGSSGGHLSLMLATRGGPGDPQADDPVDRESSAVQAVACFFPVTDLLNLGSSTENPGDGGPPIHYVKAFGPNATNLTIWKKIGREVSPIYHITTNLPPILIIHGDADTLVPLEQSQWFVERARQVGREVKLIVRHGKKHGWLGMIWDARLFADWFDRWLRPRS